MKNIDSNTHVRGESIYVDDIPVRQGTLYACAYDSKIAHGTITKLDVSAAEQFPGVVRVLTYKDIPGINEIGGIIKDEPLLAEKEVHFQGMPIALVLAETDEIAREAVHLVKVEIEEHHPIVDPREAHEKGQLIIPTRTFKLGETENAWSKCDHVLEGTAETAGQEHLYIETQGAYAYPTENGSIRISSSTQGPTSVQKTAAWVLGVPMHKIEVDVTRLGGGFGGKEDQATAWGVFTALGAYLTKKPVKYVLDRMEDMRMTGKRNPYVSDFKIGLSKDYKILAYEATYFQNAGAAADLSPAIMERTLFHSTNSYFVPNVTATAHSCRTNIPPNTAFRGFGGPQAMFVIEAAIAKAAEELGVAPSVIQKANLLQKEDEFPYGQLAGGNEAVDSWVRAENLYNIEQLRKEVTDFNSKNKLFKKGLAFMPICFGISFTKTDMNQARALVHIYQDGSVGISTAAVEMGQGVNTKMVQVAAHFLGISPSRIKIESTNTTRVANTSPSAASATADLNGKAVSIACNALVKRLKSSAIKKLGLSASCSIELKEELVVIDGKKSDLGWEELVMSAFLDRVALTENGHYSTPTIHFDKAKEKGHPFAYHVFGTAITCVTVDCLRGRYEFDYVKVAHDYGSSMNEIVDRGQTEGGIVQGIGWMTLEELMYNKQGRLMSNALSTYKIPDIYSVPKELEIDFLNTNNSDNMAIFKSKAVGEPPLMYGIGAYFAIRDAVRAFNPSANPPYYAPFTPEKVLMALYEGQTATSRVLKDVAVGRK